MTRETINAEELLFRARYAPESKYSEEADSENPPMNDFDKARILDWLLTPITTREDRDNRIDRTIKKDDTHALLVFRSWVTPEETLTALQREMAKK